MQNHDDTILIHRFLAGEATAAEADALQKWLEASPENQKQFDQIEKLWQNADAPQPENVPAFAEFWQNIEGKIEEKPMQSQAKIVEMKKGEKEFSMSGNWKWLALAASVILVVSATLFFQRARVDADAVYQTANAEQQQFALPDGTHITLNHASKLSLRENLSGDERRVYLEGQAFFDVFNDGRPFIIATENAEIRVLGTRFDVRSRDRKTQVVVEEGKVSVASLVNAEDSITLEADQKSVVIDDATPSPAEAVNAAIFYAWRAKKYVFDDVPLGEIAAELQRIFNVQIWLGSDIDRENLQIVVEGQPIHQVLTSIALTLDLSYELKEGVHMLSAR